MRHLMDHHKGAEIGEDGTLHLAKVAWRALAALQTHLEEEKQEEIIAESKVWNCSCENWCGNSYTCHPREFKEKEKGAFRRLSEEENLDLAIKKARDHIDNLRERRMNIIGQNGNDGLHYDDVISGTEAAYTFRMHDGVRVTVDTPYNV